MLIAAAAVAAALVIRAVPPRRFVFWTTWSPLAAVVGTTATFSVLMAVSWLGLIAADQSGWARTPSLTQSISACLAAHAAARRTTKSSAGASLALGLLPDIHAWVKVVLLEGRIIKVVDALSDDALLTCARRVDRAVETANARKATRALLADRAADLRTPGHATDDARDYLRDYVINATVVFELRRFG